MTEIELFDRLNPKRDLPQGTCDVISRVYEVMSKENGIVWHNLRKNPDDLPKEAGEYICIYSDAYGGDTTVIAEWHIQYQDEGEGHYLKMDENFVYNGICIDEVVIAWCEIPKFEEA